MNRKFKLYEIPQSLIQGNKFLKWTESNSNDKNNSSSGSIGVTLKVDQHGFILYWRDLNKKSDYLDIAHVRDVRIGKYANVPKDKNFRDVLSSGQSNVPIEDKTMSIYYGSDFVNLQCINFVSMAPDANMVIKEWAQHIFDCSISPRTQNLSPWEHLNKLRCILLYGKSIIDEKSREFRLPVQTVVDLFATTDKQHVESEKQHVLHMLQSVGLPSGKNDYLDEKILTQEKFFQFFLRLVSKEDIEKIFSEYGSKKKLCMNPEQFQNFFNEKQRDPRLNELLYPYYTVDKSCEMILKFETDESFRKKKQLSPQGLIRYLMDVENEVIDPAKYELCDDMDQPLCHYFINSSHNTYLSGHQVTGKTEAEMYRQVLLSGCRCIELDCWDDRNLDEPIITHGLTFCTQILFKDAIEAIKECAFKTSPYPVLLSFENHCSKGMQEKMAKYLVDCFGENLLIDPLSQYPLKPGVRLPSPEDLKYKILIKNKKSDGEKIASKLFSLRSLDQTANADGEGTTTAISAAVAATATQTMAAVFESCSNANQNGNENNQLLNSNNSQDFTKILQNLQKMGNYYGDETGNGELGHTNQVKNELNDSSDDSESENEEKNNANSPEKTITAKEMSRLVNYLQPVDFQSFEIAEKRNRSYELSSFLETKAYNLHKEKSTEFVNYNKRQFSRIYPKSTRIASDNFMPQVYWNVGCQLVALNFQTLDVGMRLNLGKFEYNNRSGYVLKPEVMRRVDVNKAFDPFAESPLDGIVAATVNAQVISGIYFNDKRERLIGHTVLVEMFGLPADTLKGQRAYRAKMVSSNTFNVVYSDSIFSFKKIIMPEVAILCFTALDEQNRLIGQRVLPIVGLRSGYRYLCLKNESNQSLNMCMLFVNINVKDYVPDKFVELADALADPIRYISNLEKREEMLKSLSDDAEISSKDVQFDVENARKESSTNDLLKASSNFSNDIIMNNNSSNNNNFFLTDNRDIKDSQNMISNSLLSSSTNLINVAASSYPNFINTPHTERLSLSVEKFHYASSQGSQSCLHSPTNFELKRRSQYDVSNTLGNSMNNITLNNSRSASLSSNNNNKHVCNSSNNNEINYTDILLSADPNIFADIDIDQLKTSSKAYMNIEKVYNKKIKKLEKEAEKKVADIIQSHNSEVDKATNEFIRSKQKLEKEISKAEKSATKRSSLNDAHNMSLSEMKMNYKSHFESIDNDLMCTLTVLREKQIKEILNVYQEMYKQIKNVQVLSLDPLYAKLEKCALEIQEQRMQSLKLIADNEIAEVKKHVHQEIKFKKKNALKNAHDKEEFQRLSREIEKDSVSIAVEESSKMTELLKIKQKLLKKLVEKSINIIKEQKEKQKVAYENDCVKNYELKRVKIEEEFRKPVNLKHKNSQSGFLKFTSSSLKLYTSTDHGNNDSTNL